MNSPSPLQGLEPSTNCTDMPKQNPKTKNPKRKGTASSKTQALGRPAPINMGYTAPRVHFTTDRPITKGACARYLGVDFAGTISSSSAAALTGSAYTITPASSSLFARLSAIQDVFLRWRLIRLRLHFIGRSASTQPGVGSFASFVLDTTSALINIATAQTIKNAEGCLTLKGWENGFHDVDCESAGVRWYNTDGDSLPSKMGTVGQYVPQTTANGDLSWDVFAEYDCEFAEAIDTSTVSPLMKEKQAENKEEETTASLTEQLIQLRKKLIQRSTTSE